MRKLNIFLGALRNNMNWGMSGRILGFLVIFSAGSIHCHPQRYLGGDVGAKTKCQKETDVREC